ncbi:MAG: tetratricopeptide repeat protein, partial [Photobacterium frigidiphilum]|uniref:tetratricopeptide repeat protein n=1 Tax=Photobacterium frigidiphilum TaxID=264736 RepID=UPI0030038FDA
MNYKCTKLSLVLTSILLLSSCAATYEDGITAIHSNNKEDAEEIFTELAEKGDAQAMYQLYNHINHSSQWLKKSADAGYAIAQYEYGVYLLEEDVKNTFSDGVKYLKKSALQHYEKAEVYIKDNREIIQLKLNAEQSFAQDQYILGVRYDYGQGVKQSYQEATKWYRKAAEQGNASAQFNLGIMYDNGQGVKQSDQEATKWFRKAAEQGYASAQFNLGVMYKNGQGVKQSYQEAAKWYRKAAKQGYASAQNNLGIMYDNGQGVKQSDQEAT